MLKVSALYLEKQKSFISKKTPLSISKQKSLVYWLNFPGRVWIRPNVGEEQGFAVQSHISRPRSSKCSLLSWKIPQNKRTFNFDLLNFSFIYCPKFDKAFFVVVLQKRNATPSLGPVWNMTWYQVNLVRSCVWKFDQQVAMCLKLRHFRMKYILWWWVWMGGWELGRVGVGF